ncbi:MAG: hypothetical protein WCQ72_02425 [Eubacteriales bacterium]
MKRLLALLLCALVLVTAVGCGDNAGGTAQTTTAAAADGETTTAGEPSRENMPDNLPDDLDLEGATINILYFGNDDSNNYDAVGESSGDIVYDAVYNRNVKVEERLNVKLNWIKGSGDWDTHPADIQKAMLAGVSDYDIIFEENSRAFQHSLEGYFYDLIDAPYLDIEQPWWYTNLMNEGSIDTTKRYFVTGSFSMTTLFGASTVYFNKDMYTNIYGDYNELYNLVLNGTWTHDKLMEYCRGAYSDLNGDGTADANDQYGFRYGQWGVPNYLSMSTGLSYSTRDADGYPVMNLNTPDTVEWAEKLYKLLYRDNMSYEIKDEVSSTFEKGNDLFFIYLLGSANSLRNADFEYGVLPYPKLNETLDYVSGAATANGEGAVIPLSAPIEKFEYDCAVLEALSAEAYRTVVPTWYETALKIKYVASDTDAQMIDLIYSKINSPFIMMADKAIGTGSIFTNAVYGAKSEGTYSSFYAKQESTLTSKWNKMIESYKALGE